MCCFKEERREERSGYLSVGEDGGVVALEAALDQLLCAVGVDGGLVGVHVENEVVGEGLVLSQHHMGLARRDERADVASLNLLTSQLRSNPTREGFKPSVSQAVNTPINTINSLTRSRERERERERDLDIKTKRQKEKEIKRV